MGALTGDATTRLTNRTAWSSTGTLGGTARRGVKAELLYLGTSKWRREQPFTSQPDDVARTIVTVWTRAGNFSGHHEWVLPDRPNGLFSEGHGCLTHAIGPPGVGGHLDGVHAFGPGSIGWGLIEHYRMTGDTEWWRKNAPRMKAEAEAYRRDLLAAVERSIALSPVVPVRDGTFHSVIPFACYVRGMSTRAWGWRRNGSGSHVGPLYWETVQSAAALISPAGLLPPEDVRVQGYRDVFNEHAVHGPPDKIFEEAAFLERFRNLLAMEQGDALWIARGTPRAWFEQGQTIAVRRAPTHFGPLAYDIVSDVDHGRIAATVAIPSRTAPRTVCLRLRHPQAAPMRSVTVNGEPWRDFDAAREIVRLEGLSGTVVVSASY